MIHLHLYKVVRILKTQMDARVEETRKAEILDQKAKLLQARFRLIMLLKRGGGLETIQRNRIRHSLTMINELKKSSAEKEAKRHLLWFLAETQRMNNVKN